MTKQRLWLRSCGGWSFTTRNRKSAESNKCDKLFSAGDQGTGQGYQILVPILNARRRCRAFEVRLTERYSLGRKIDSMVQYES
jgi:hypothetical protein